MFDGDWDFIINPGQDDQDTKWALPEDLVFEPTVDEYLPNELRYYAKNHKRNLGLVYFRANNDSINNIAVPVCLPKQPAPKPNTTCYISGIGNTNKKVMKTAPIKILSKEDCRQLSSVKDYKKHEDSGIIQQDICGTNIAGNCQQFLDAGSPLICNEDGKAVVYGVASLMLDGNVFINVLSSNVNNCTKNLHY